TLGHLFCDGQASAITNLLQSECDAAGVRILTSVTVERVESRSGFLVFAGESLFHAAVLVVATGGLSIPKMGATSLGYDLARQFGLKIIAPRAALVPFTFSTADRERYSDL